MPESEIHHAPAEEEVAPEAIYPETAQQAYADRLTLATKRLEVFFDQATIEGKEPTGSFIQDVNTEKLEYTHGKEATEKIMAALQAVPPGLEREEFISRIRDIVAPAIWLEITNSDVSARQSGYAPEKEHHFQTSDSGLSIDGLLRNTDQELRFEGGAVLPVGSKVMEVSWPKETAAPQGLHGMKEVFHVMAEYLNDHPEIQAVTGVSWMMSHPISRRLGFQVMPNVQIKPNQPRGSAEMGNAARVSNGREADISPADVFFGAMTREDFLQRFVSDSGRRSIHTPESHEKADRVVRRISRKEHF